MLEVRYIFDWLDKPVNEYTLRNGKYQFSAINIGAALTKIIVPNKFDKLENITLRYYDYKLYKDNKYLLGALIDYEKFIKNEACQLNYYFDCKPDNDSLIFIYEENENYIRVSYTLNENYLLIKSENSYDLNLGNVIFLNLSGNLKDTIKNHDLMIAGEKINPEIEIRDFMKFQCDDNQIIDFSCKDTGIHVSIFAEKDNLHMSSGSYFNKEFFLNKKVEADAFWGIGFAFGCSSICFEF